MRNYEPRLIACGADVAQESRRKEVFSNTH